MSPHLTPATEDGPEPSAPSAALRDHALVTEAQAALSRRLGCSYAEAAWHLREISGDLGLSLPETAARLLRARADEPAPEAVPEAPGPAVLPPPDGSPPGTRGFAAAEAAPADARILAGVPDDPQARAVLEAALFSAAHLVPIHGADGRVVDFLYADLNEEAQDLFGRGVGELRGRRLLPTSPGALRAGLFDHYRQVWETGRSYRSGPIDYRNAQAGSVRVSRMSVRCSRVPTGVILTWHFHREEDRIRGRHDSVERLAQIGFGEWDLGTGEVDWSPQMAANFGLAGGEPPAAPDRLHECVAAADAPMVAERMRTLLAERRPVEFEHGSADGSRLLRTCAEPVLDPAGLVVGVTVVSQDVSRPRATERALAETRREVLRQQWRIEQEHRVAGTLRCAVLPAGTDVQRPPGMRLAVRSVAAESAARIGGDWYATRALPDGRGLFAVGDVAGHGLPAAAAMARTRGGLLGLAYTGRPPGRLVAWLNELTCDMEPVATGTAVVCRFDPRERLLEWASAGHLPPLLLRGGEASVLRTPSDPLLGAMEGLEYGTHSVRLEPGDRVVLYTDGLVERRDADIADGIARLVRLLEGESGEPPEIMDRVLDAMGHDRFADDTTLLVAEID